tara:strand:+ start:270 stop:428 length:159 start_codon:yes stop_codon:yes gene_type:complete
MKNEDLKELKKIITESLSAHQRANWDNADARKIIVDVMIKKFKRYLEKENAN